MTATPSEVAAGSNVTYEIQVKNQGLLDAPAVHVVDTLPASAVLVSASVLNIGSLATPDCYLGTIGAGATKSFKVVVRPLGVGSITNTATAATYYPESTTANNSATATVTSHATRGRGTRH